MSSIGKLLYAFIKGIYMGKDSLGNKYYQSKEAERGFGRKKRWMVYRGIPEPTKISPLWYNWLHYQSDEAPCGVDPIYLWEKDKLPNLTGTKYAYYPKGHIHSGANRGRATGDYQPWRPSE